MFNRQLLMWVGLATVVSGGIIAICSLTMGGEISSGSGGEYEWILQALPPCGQWPSDTEQKHHARKMGVRGDSTMACAHETTRDLFPSGNKPTLESCLGWCLQTHRLSSGKDGWCCEFHQGSSKDDPSTCAWSDGLPVTLSIAQDTLTAADLDLPSPVGNTLAMRTCPPSDEQVVSAGSPAPAVGLEAGSPGPVLGQKYDHEYYECPEGKGKMHDAICIDYHGCSQICLPQVFFGIAQKHGVQKGHCCHDHGYCTFIYHSSQAGVNFNMFSKTNHTNSTSPSPSPAPAPSPEPSPSPSPGSMKGNKGKKGKNT